MSDLPKLTLSSDPSKNDILVCATQLAERAVELGYSELGANLLIVAGASGDDEDERAVSSILYAYAQYKLAAMIQEQKPNEKDEDKN